VVVAICTVLSIVMPHPKAGTGGRHEKCMLVELVPDLKKVEPRLPELKLVL
jgi:hypothetical protein